MQINVGDKFTRREKWNDGHIFVVERIYHPYYDIRDLQSRAVAPVSIYTPEQIERLLTPVAPTNASR